MNTSTIKQTPYEKKHDILPATESRSDAMRETPQEYRERIKRDVEAGLRPPPPEKVDRAKIDEETRRIELERSSIAEGLPGHVPGTRQEVARKPEDPETEKVGGMGIKTSELPGSADVSGATGAHSSHASENDDDLDAHTVDELRTIAHREGAEVRHDMVKADIVKSIKKNRKKNA